MGKYRKKGTWKTVVLSILCVVLSVVLLAVVASAILLDRMLGKIDRVTGTEQTLSSSELHELLNPTETRGEDYTGPAYKDDEITMPTEPAEIIEKENKINILLIGVIVLIAGLLIRSMIRSRKAGKSPCGGNCACCGACSGCSKCSAEITFKKNM